MSKQNKEGRHKDSIGANNKRSRDMVSTCELPIPNIDSFPGHETLSGTVLGYPARIKIQTKQQ